MIALLLRASRRALVSTLKTHPSLVRLGKRVVASPRVRGNRAYRWLHEKRMQREMARWACFPAHVNIELTNACNAACLMCPRGAMTRPVGVMDEALFRRIADEVARHQPLSVVLNGYGESLLDRRLGDRIRYAKERGVGPLSLYTNASTITPARAEELVRTGLDHLSISLDGYAKETYERVRVGLSFERTQASIEYLLAARAAHGEGRRPRITVTMVRIVENDAEVAAFLAHYLGRVDEVYVQSPKNWGGAYEVRSPDGFHASDTEPDRPPCPYLWRNLNILQDGRVALCCLDFDGTTVLGDLRGQGIAEVWRSEPYVRVREAHRRRDLRAYALCGRCNYRSVWW